MTITGIAPGPSAGPAGEYAFAQACRARGCHVQGWGVENRLSPFALGIGHRIYADWSSELDFLVYRELGHNNMPGLPADKCPILFGADCKGVTQLRDRQDFAISERSLNGAVAFVTSHHFWGVFALIGWDPSDIRIVTPVEVMARPYDAQYQRYIVDASECRTLDNWLGEFPPFIGGPLARDWPTPPGGNVIQLQAA